MDWDTRGARRAASRADLDSPALSSEGLKPGHVKLGSLSQVLPKSQKPLLCH